MGVENLQCFVEGGHMEGVAENVDLLHVARAVQARHKSSKAKQYNKKLCLVLDAECCLDRLYGGYFSGLYLFLFFCVFILCVLDWTCGGQWNRMMQFLNQLLNACQKGNIEFTVAFNGALERKRMPEWVHHQMSNRQKIQNVLRHLHNKGTPPPKVWWVPPPCLATALRLALRHLNVPMMSSIEDHHHEVLAFCRSNNLHGIVGDDAEYLVFDPPRYFSARTLKLTFKGSIETREFFVKKLVQGFGLDTQKFCILTALLGNHILNEAQLTPLYAKLKTNTANEEHEIVQIIAEFVKNLKSSDNLLEIGAEIFGEDELKRKAFVESVNYYLQANPDAFVQKSSEHDDQTVPNGSKFASEIDEVCLFILKFIKHYFKLPRMEIQKLLMGFPKSVTHPSSYWTKKMRLVRVLPLMQ